MRRRQPLAFALLAAAVLAPWSASEAQSLTSPYNSNNSGGLGGAVYFDALVGSRGLRVTGFDINTFETAAFTNFQVWLFAGTSQGNELAGGWTQVALGSGTGAGVDNPTSVTLSNSFDLTANTLYGIALVNDPAIGHDYSSDGEFLASVSNADLTLNFGSASNSPFTDFVFTDRTFNGTIYYDVLSVPEPSSVALVGAALLMLSAVVVARRKRFSR